MTCPAPWPSPCCCPPLLRPCLLLLFCSRQLCVRTCHTCYKYLEEHIYLHRRWSLRRPLRRLDALNLLHNSAQVFAFAQATIKCSFKPDFFSPATTQPVFKLSSLFLLIAARTTRCVFLESFTTWSKPPLKLEFKISMSFLHGGFARRLFTTMLKHSPRFEPFDLFNHRDDLRRLCISKERQGVAQLGRHTAHRLLADIKQVDVEAQRLSLCLQVSARFSSLSWPCLLCLCHTGSSTI